eukprot:COSAG06_NODE_3402_length_5394_cov_12.090115_8_plen_88_part_00
MHPEPIESAGVALAVLLFAGAAEGYTLSVAWQEIKVRKRVVFLLRYHFCIKTIILPRQDRDKQRGQITHKATRFLIARVDARGPEHG